MIVQVIGSHGGVAPEAMATSYLINGNVLIDAGSVASGLQLAEQAAIDHILISHAHLDHIKDLAFLCDNCFGVRDRPFEVYCNQYVDNAISKHLFNDVIWPNFTSLPSVQNPTIRFNVIQSGQVLELLGLKIMAVQVNHPGNALGFIVEGPGEASGETATVVFTQDTGPTQKIWQQAKERGKVQGIFTEVSFPNELGKLARESCHHTPQTLEQELAKMPPSGQIFLGHLKPAHEQQLQQQIQALGHPQISVLDSSQSIYRF